MKKIMSLILTLTLMVGVTTTNIFARENMQKDNNTTTLIGIKEKLLEGSDSIEIPEDAIVAPKTPVVSKTFYEYDYLKKVLSREEINNLLLNKFKSEGVINGVQVDMLQHEKLINALDEDAIRASLATITLSQTITSHYYSSSANQTVAYVSYLWKWSKKPNFIMKDIVGVAWEADKVMSLDNEFNYSHNTLEVYNMDTSVLLGTARKNWVEYEFNTLGQKFNMLNQTDDSNSHIGYVLSGFGRYKLICSGKSENIKTAFKYGHQQLTLGSPSLSYPWGLGFTMQNVTDKYEAAVESSSL